MAEIKRIVISKNQKEREILALERIGDKLQTIIEQSPKERMMNDKHIFTKLAYQEGFKDGLVKSEKEISKERHSKFLDRKLLFKIIKDVLERDNHDGYIHKDRFMESLLEEIRENSSDYLKELEQQNKDIMDKIEKMNIISCVVSENGTMHRISGAKLLEKLKDKQNIEELNDAIEQDGE